MTAVLGWGALAGVVHFAVIAVLYGNPIVDRIDRAFEGSPAMKRWPSKPRYFATQFLGTQVEVYILTAAFFWLRPGIGVPGYPGALLLGGVFTAIRVYPRFWNMWIQTTYPFPLLVIEVINGTIGTLTIALFLQFVSSR